jgi:hypothetical protein
MTGGRHGSHRHYMQIVCLCAIVGACVAINVTAAEKASLDNSYLCVVGCLLYTKRRKREDWSDVGNCTVMPEAPVTCSRHLSRRESRYTCTCTLCLFTVMSSAMFNPSILKVAIERLHRGCQNHLEGIMRSNVTTTFCRTFHRGTHCP